MALIDDRKEPGFYYVGYVTEESHESMPSDEARKKWPIGMAMSNTKPFRTRKGALRVAKAHDLRDITVLKN